MTKSDAIWLVIRTLGLVLVLLAILRLAELVGLIAWVWEIGEPTTSSVGDSIRSATMWRVTWGSLASSALYGAIGLYLLRRGDWVYSLLDLAASKRSNISVERDAP